MKHYVNTDRYSLFILDSEHEKLRAAIASRYGLSAIFIEFPKYLMDINVIHIGICHIGIYHIGICHIGIYHIGICHIGIYHIGIYHIGIYHIGIYHMSFSIHPHHSIASGH
ncbi:unnamed protein product [Dracunculus medinensis]|uniref:Uncharacterized protein n=1 Tax=Dracunculus medinensis TaxID=318479 RepID=A0A0N4U221_DRAME|nr:unnamed protein product [Dracunculus medinensis]